MKKIYIALMLSAMTGLIYEIVATNMLFYYFVENTYSLATILSVFLFGLGLGSLLFHKFKHKIKNKASLFGVIQLIIGLYGLIVLTNIPNIIPSINTFGIFISSFLLLLVPTICLGIIFPLSGDIMRDGKEENIGLVYFVDLMGAMFGVLIAGFWLIPILGNKITILIAVILNLIAMVIMSRKKVFILVGVVVLLFFIINGQIPNEEPTSFFKPSAYGEVKVEEGILSIENRPQCWISMDSSTGERKIANLSIEPFDSKDLDVLNIGLGCGLTASRILDLVGKVDIVEINPVVVEVDSLLSNLQINPKANIIIDDGLNYLRNTEKQYDIIILDIENPAVIHSSDLYTIESFKLIYDSLNEDGVFGLWSYYCEEIEYYDIIYNSLNSFPFVYYFEQDLIFIASKQELNYSRYTKPNHNKINSLDKKELSKFYFERCGNLNKSDPYLFK